MAWAGKPRVWPFGCSHTCHFSGDGCLCCQTHRPRERGAVFYPSIPRTQQSDLLMGANIFRNKYSSRAGKEEQMSQLTLPCPDTGPASPHERGNGSHRQWAFRDCLRPTASVGLEVHSVRSASLSNLGAPCFLNQNSNPSHWEAGLCSGGQGAKIRVSTGLVSSEASLLVCTRLCPPRLHGPVLFVSLLSLGKAQTSLCLPWSGGVGHHDRTGTGGHRTGTQDTGQGLGTQGRGWGTQDGGWGTREGWQGLCLRRY